MPEAFLSYAVQDRETADRLVHDLRSAGISVWYDADIDPGARWQPIIERQLETADAVILLISPASLGSIRVTAEWSAAVDRSARVLPVLVGGASVTDLPGRLTDIRVVDLGRDYDAGVRQLVTAVTELGSSTEPPATAGLDRDQLVREIIAHVMARVPPPPSPNGAAEDDLVFVVASFAPELEPIYEAICAAAAVVGMRAEWLRDARGDYRITDKVIEKIRNARLIVADLTSERPNVYFELGYARGLGKTVVTIARAGTHVHVDVRDWNYEQYIDSRPLERVLVECFRQELDRS